MARFGIGLVILLVLGCACEVGDEGSGATPNDSDESALVIANLGGPHVIVTAWNGGDPALVACGTSWYALGREKPPGPWHLTIRDPLDGRILFDEDFEDEGTWSVHVKGDQVLLRRAGEPGLSDPIPNAYACANAGPLPTLATP